MKIGSGWRKMKVKTTLTTNLYLHGFFIRLIIYLLGLQAISCRLYIIENIPAIVACRGSPTQ